MKQAKFEACRFCGVSFKVQRKHQVFCPKPKRCRMQWHIALRRNAINAYREPKEGGQHPPGYPQGRQNVGVGEGSGGSGEENYVPTESPAQKDVASEAAGHSGE